MRISYWSSDVCSSDLGPARAARRPRAKLDEAPRGGQGFGQANSGAWRVVRPRRWRPAGGAAARCAGVRGPDRGARMRSEEHTSELQSLMRISYAVFCLKKKSNTYVTNYTHERISDR